MCVIAVMVGIIVALVLYLKNRKKKKSFSEETNEMESSEYFTNSTEIFTEMRAMTQDMAFTNSEFNNEKILIDNFEETESLHLL